MNIKQLEQQTGMTRANIRFYEQQGLIAPTRLDNKYRDYSQADFEVLNKIKLLRALEVSIDEIKQLQSDKEELNVVLGRKIKILEQKRLEAQKAKELCILIKEENVTYKNLNAEKYLSSTAQQEFEFLKKPLPEGEAYAFCPWRRFFARTLDLSVYTILWQAVLEFIFKTNFDALNSSAAIIHVIMPILLMLIIEPLLLTFFKTTPGKLILGLRLEPEAGEKIKYAEARLRTWQVVYSGFGLFLPFYSIYKLWKSYETCRSNEKMPWDYGFEYTIKDESKKRTYAYIGAYVIILISPFLIFFASRMPQNRGELTISEFAENFNALNNYYGIYITGLNESGQFENSSTEIVISAFNIPTPLFNYVTDDDGYIKELSFTAGAENEQNAPRYAYEMLLSALSFAGAQRSVGVFSPFVQDITKQIDNNPYESYSYAYKDFEIICTYDINGYDIDPYNGIAFAPDGGSSYNIEFKIRLTDN